MLVESNSCENCAVRERMRIVRKQTIILTPTMNICEFTFNNIIRKNYLVSRSPDTMMPQYNDACLGEEGVVSCREEAQERSLFVHELNTTSA
jgi:hypothetical protein